MPSLEGIAFKLVIQLYTVRLLASRWCPVLGPVDSMVMCPLPPPLR